MAHSFVLHFDGCSKGNPGKSGCGAVIYKDGEEIWRGMKYVGDKSTNNIAEYSGLILGLESAVKLNIKNILVKGDSELVIKQMLGEYKVKNPTLYQLHMYIKKLEESFELINYVHVYRHDNKVADMLSNQSIM